MCTPSPHAEHAERKLFGDGFEVPDRYDWWMRLEELHPQLFQSIQAVDPAWTKEDIAK